MMACDAAIREVTKRLPKDIADRPDFDTHANQLFKEINWWTKQTIREALRIAIDRRLHGTDI